MNREEAEDHANELLRYYGKQRWKDHYKVEGTIDNPSDHILVKNADEFIAMLQRRGYTVISEQGAGVYGKMYSVQTRFVPSQLVFSCTRRLQMLLSD